MAFDLMAEENQIYLFLVITGILIIAVFIVVIFTVCVQRCCCEDKQNEEKEPGDNLAVQPNNQKQDDENTPTIAPTPSSNQNKLPECAYNTVNGADSAINSEMIKIEM